jgi:ketosteroid isomerase-like protein
MAFEPVIFNRRGENYMCGIRSVTAISLILLFGGCLSRSSSAATPSAGATRSQIELALRTIEQALARGDGATAISRMMYAENDRLTGEGQSGSTRQMAGTIKDFQEWLESLGPGGAKGCKFTIVDPVVASSLTFSSFVQLHCSANPPGLPKDQEYRVLYVWRKLPEGWRVVLEMYLSGIL